MLYTFYIMAKVNETLSERRERLQESREKKEIVVSFRINIAQHDALLKYCAEKTRLNVSEGARLLLLKGLGIL